MSSKVAVVFFLISIILALTVTLSCDIPQEEGRDGTNPTTAESVGQQIGTEGKERTIQKRLFSEGSGFESSKQYPNILVVAFDNVRADRMSSYGNSRPTTPNLDSLAVRGVRFSRCISQAPYTPHSFSSILSSLYVSDLPVRVRARKPKDLERAGLEEYHVTLAEALQESGYATAAVVMGWFTEAFGLQQGFEWVSYKKRTVPEVVDESLRWLQEWSLQDRDRPFFLFSYSLDVHAEFMSGKSMDQHVFGGDPSGFTYSREQMKQVTRKEKRPTKEDFANAMTVYDEGLYWSDYELNRLFRGLDDLDLSRNTILVFISDHGEEFGEKGFLGHGQSNFSGVIDVPLIIADPRLNGGLVVNERVMNIDIMPTILDLAGVPIPAAAKGLSLAASMRGESQPELLARPLFSEGATNGFFGATIVGPYKLLVRRPINRRYLFNIDVDPYETKNLIGDLPGLARRLEEILFSHKRNGLATQILLSLETPILFDRMALPRTASNGIRSRAEESREVISEETQEQLKALGYL